MKEAIEYSLGYFPSVGNLLTFHRARLATWNYGAQSEFDCGRSYTRNLCIKLLVTAKCEVQVSNRIIHMDSSHPTIITRLKN